MRARRAPFYQSSHFRMNATHTATSLDDLLTSHDEGTSTRTAFELDPSVLMDTAILPFRFNVTGNVSKIETAYYTSPPCPGLRRIYACYLQDLSPEDVEVSSNVLECASEDAGGIQYHTTVAYNVTDFHLASDNVILVMSFDGTVRIRQLSFPSCGDYPLMSFEPPAAQYVQDASFVRFAEYTMNSNDGAGTEVASCAKTTDKGLACFKLNPYPVSSNPPQQQQVFRISTLDQRVDDAFMVGLMICAHVDNRTSVECFSLSATESLSLFGGVSRVPHVFHPMRSWGSVEGVSKVGEPMINFAHLDSQGVVWVDNDLEYVRQGYPSPVSKLSLEKGLPIAAYLNINSGGTVYWAFLHLHNASFFAQFAPVPKHVSGNSTWSCSGSSFDFAYDEKFSPTTTNLSDADVCQGLKEGYYARMFQLLGERSALDWVSLTPYTPSCTKMLGFLLAECDNDLSPIRVHFELFKARGCAAGSPAMMTSCREFVVSSMLAVIGKPANALPSDICTPIGRLFYADVAQLPNALETFDARLLSAPVCYACLTDDRYWPLLGLGIGLLAGYVIRWNEALRAIFFVMFAVTIGVLAAYVRQSASARCEPYYIYRMNALLVSFLVLLSFFLGFFAMHLILFLSTPIRVLDLQTMTPKVTKLWRTRFVDKAFIISWRWDVSSASEFERSATLQECFAKAKSMNFSTAVVDIVTLEQKSIRADVVERFTQLYQTLPVLVAVRDQKTSDEYQGRFWCNIEMLRYRSNRRVMTLAEDDDVLPVPRHESPPSVYSVAVSRSNKSTANIDRVLVFFLSLPLSHALFSPVFRVVEHIKRHGRDVPEEAARNIVFRAGGMQDVLLTSVLNHPRFYVRMLWPLLMTIPVQPSMFINSESSFSSNRFALWMVLLVLPVWSIILALLVYSIATVMSKDTRLTGGTIDMDIMQNPLLKGFVIRSQACNEDGTVISCVLYLIPYLLFSVLAAAAGILGRMLFALVSGIGIARTLRTMDYADDGKNTKNQTLMARVDHVGNDDNGEQQQTDDKPDDQDDRRRQRRRWFPVRRDRILLLIAAIIIPVASILSGGLAALQRYPGIQATFSLAGLDYNSYGGNFALSETADRIAFGNRRTGVVHVYRRLSSSPLTYGPDDGSPLMITNFTLPPSSFPESYAPIHVAMNANGTVVIAGFRQSATVSVFLREDEVDGQSTWQNQSGVSLEYVPIEGIVAINSPGTRMAVTSTGPMLVKIFSRPSIASTQWTEEDTSSVVGYATNGSLNMPRSVGELSFDSQGDRLAIGLTGYDQDRGKGLVVILVRSALPSPVWLVEQAMGAPQTAEDEVWGGSVGLSGAGDVLVVGIGAVEMGSNNSVYASVFTRSGPSSTPSQPSASPTTSSPSTSQPSTSPTPPWNQQARLPLTKATSLGLVKVSVSTTGDVIVAGSSQYMTFTKPGASSQSNEWVAMEDKVNYVDARIYFADGKVSKDGQSVVRVGADPSSKPLLKVGAFVDIR